MQLYGKIKLTFMAVLPEIYRVVLIILNFYKKIIKAGTLF